MLRVSFACSSWRVWMLPVRSFGGPGNSCKPISQSTTPDMSNFASAGYCQNCAIYTAIKAYRRAFAIKGKHAFYMRRECREPNHGLASNLMVPISNRDSITHSTASPPLFLLVPNFTQTSHKKTLFPVQAMLYCHFPVLVVLHYSRTFRTHLRRDL
ncbi:hypothetical protein EDB19DRAFT_1328151 [Suillus lakei]|nr:hypothetical protein EDB19DRAFT_1328151 [Suillus lakei]